MNNSIKLCLEDARKIIEHYRRPITKKNTAINLNSEDTSILTSYFLEKETPLVDEISNLLTNKEKFEEQLLNYIPLKKSSRDLPTLNNGRSYHFQMDIINFLSEELNQYFFSDNNMALMATRTPKKYEYPSGKEIEYSLLENEFSANMPIYIPAMGNSINKYEIVVRENSLNYLIAKALNNKNQLPLEQTDDENSVKEKLLGVMISHENAEINIPDKDKINQYQMKVEILAEINSVNFLKKNGFDMKSYRLFHKLRGDPENPEDLSGLISTNNYSPISAYMKLCPTFH